MKTIKSRRNYPESQARQDSGFWVKKLQTQLMDFMALEKNKAID